MHRAFLLFYNVLILILSPLVLVFLAFFKRGRQLLWQRVGLWNLPAGKYLWFHGASLGEMTGIVPLLEWYAQREPHSKFLVTATSASAKDRVHELAHEFRLLPFDTYLFYFVALRRVEITRVYLFETEIWPACLYFLQKNKIQVVWVNAFISDRSWPRYKRLAWFFRPLFAVVHPIFAVSARSAERVGTLLKNDRCALITGSTKYRLPTGSPKSSARLTSIFDSEKPIVVLGSLRPGEEVFFESAIAESCASGSHYFLIAPRHAEKFEYFATWLSKMGVPFSFYSHLVSASPKTANVDVVLLDSIGELSQFYQGAQLAFVGGTLVPVGGHNPLEAAAAGVSLCFGPYIQNIEPIAQELLEQGAAQTICSPQSVHEILNALIQSPQVFQVKGQKAREIADRTSRSAEAVKDALIQSRIL
jgi:3-deoxy-D-manno-octulosonic-acid transferase